MRALIVGAGIAGLAASILLRRAGVDVDLIERADAPSSAGYNVNITGRALAVAGRIGIGDRLRAHNIPVAHSHIMDATGTLIRRMDIAAFSDPDKLGLFLPRRDLEKVLGDYAGRLGPVHYGEGIRHLERGDNTVTIVFEDGSTNSYDFIVGADGVHSQVREAAGLGTATTDLGVAFLAFELDTSVGAETGAYSLIDVDHSVLVTNLAGKACSGLFWQRAGPDVEPSTIWASNAMGAVFGRFGWHVPQILAGLETAKTCFVDRAVQVRLDTWSAGRVVLIGDAAHAVSPLAAKGASLALLGAAELADALATAADPRQAFYAYQASLAPVVAKVQTATLRNRDFLVPKTRKAVDGSMAFVRYTPAFVMNWMARADVKAIS